MRPEGEAWTGQVRREWMLSYESEADFMGNWNSLKNFKQENIIIKANV